MKNDNGSVRDIFSALIAIIISFAVYKVLGQLVKDTLSNLYVANFAAQLIFAIPVFFAVILLKKTEIYRSDPKKLKAGMCAVYYRTGKCLWFLIALHALNDAVLMIEQGILAGVSEAEVLVGSTGTGLVRVVIPILFYGLIALFLLRRKKLEPLIQDNR